MHINLKERRLLFFFFVKKKRSLILKISFHYLYMDVLD